MRADELLRAALAEVESEIALLQKRRDQIIAVLGTKTEGSGPGKAEAVGLRGTIRSVLASSPKGLRPSEVRAALEKRGYQHTGEVPLGARIGTEMWRMGKTGALKKAGKRYVLPKEERPREENEEDSPVTQ